MRKGRQLMQWLLAFAIGALALLFFRATAITLCVVEGPALEPFLLQGDRVVVNRWSYGLRTGVDSGLFAYGRLLRQMPQRGDVVAIDAPGDRSGAFLLCRCKALPGDTITVKGELLLVPGKTATCASQDYYLMEALPSRSSIRQDDDSRYLGLVAECHIVGKAVCVLYSFDDTQGWMAGFRRGRFCRTIPSIPVAHPQTIPVTHPQTTVAPQP